MSARRFEGPGERFAADVELPGDKSLTHRALIFAALANGASRVANQAAGLDVDATRRALASLGVDTGRVISSAGPTAWVAPQSPIGCGNSGTTMRLLTGAVAARPFTTVLVGDESLMRRPMKRLVGPLEALGARVAVSEDGCPPIHITGGALTGADVTLEVASAQVRTAVALAAVQADGVTRIDSPAGFRDHTERWLVALGMARRQSETAVHITPGPLPPIDVALPGDPSSAAFLWAAAAITEGAVVTTRRVSLNPGRLGFLRSLVAMGAAVDQVVTGEVLGDPVGDVTVGHAPLRAVTVTGSEAVAAMDEAPLLGVVACFAHGDTVLSDSAELRAKETDRIAGTVEMIRAIGGIAEEANDGFVVTGTRPSGGRVEAGGDHRLAMAAAVVASSGCRVDVEGFAASAVSWPGFDGVLESVWSSR